MRISGGSLAGIGFLATLLILIAVAIGLDLGDPRRLEDPQSIDTPRSEVRRGDGAHHTVVSHQAGAPSLDTPYAKGAEDSARRVGWKFEYEDGDRITKLTDPAGRDTRLRYSFDGAKRLRKVLRAQTEGPTVSREFDEQGRLQRMTDGAGDVSYGYDERGRINRVQRQGTPATAYAYDTRDRVTRLQVGDFYRIDYVYDFLGRLESMKTPAGDIQYEYLTGQGKVVRTLPNGVKTIWEYEPNGRLRQITHADGRNAILAEYTYDYRPDGLIKAIRERSPSGQFVKAYEYDLVGRLVKASGSGGQQYAYEYDVIGNRTKAVSTGKPAQTYAYDWGGRLTGVDGKPTEHDAAGNLTSLPIAGSTLKYLHNQDGQLAEVDGKVSYRYDGDGNLIGRKAGGVEASFVPDPLAPIWRPLVTTGKGGQPTLIVWEGATPLLLLKDGKPEYFLEDHLGSVRLVVDKQGQSTQRFDYDPSGTPVNSDAAKEFAPRFAGLLWDEEAQAYLTRERGYSPRLGRFMQTDPQHGVPLGSKMVLSTYAYCGGDPVNFLDIDGAEPTRLTRQYSLAVPTGPLLVPDVGKLVAESTEFIDEQIFQRIYDYQHPNVRYAVVWQMIDEVWRSSYLQGEEPAHARRAWLLMYGRRYHKLPMPELRSSDGPQIVLNEEELQAAEHYWVKRAAIETGNIPGGRHKPVAPGKPAQAVADRDDWLWGVAGFIGATPGLSYSKERNRSRFSPEFFLDLTDPKLNFWDRLTEMWKDYSFQKPTQNWLRESKATHDFEKWGDKDGLAAQLARATGKAVSAPHPRSESERPESELWQSMLNPLTVTPAYADCCETLPTRLAPSRVGRAYLSGSSQSGDASESSPAKWTTQSSVGDVHLARPSDLAAKSPSATRRSEPKLPSVKAPEKPSHDTDCNTGSRSGCNLVGQQAVAPPPPPPPPPPAGSGGSGGRSAIAQHAPVGGIRLGGAGQRLEGFGLVHAIVLDPNNNLVLISKGGSEIKLPPLRLDDVVTIFRSVYLHGEGPSVTIDPSPENPEGSAMIIRHGKATENTYVGWVLYQADRLMKGYTLGVDNVTAKDLVTSIPGHADVLNTIFFGGENPDKLRKEGHWQRFWIVPAESRRFVAPKKELTLFDVPLEVKTQSMKWENGKLVDDSRGKSSPGALAFKNWFTSNYDAIARERFLTPPRESGITEPVPVFTELRRIALMTAIAEKLRDQGVPMPFWMREYEVPPVPFEGITPGRLVTRSNERLTARIYGGVNLSVADKDARTYTSGSDLAKTPSKVAVSVRQNLALADALEEAVRPLAATSEPVKVRTFSHAGTNYQAAALPGAETQALAPARIEETDLVVPVPGREPIRLVRSYNSFFDPAGPWGKGWALDLPRLDELRVPVSRSDKGVEFQRAYELVTPLNSVYARFARIESVAALNGSRLQVPDQPGDFLGLADGKPEFLTGQTRQLIRGDGGAWHFSNSGQLVAIEQSGSRVVYERDEKGRVSRIVGLAGQRPVASIDLRYDDSGRIERATAKGGQRETAVRYEYDANGKLAGVVSDSGRLGYRYTGSLLTEVTGKPARGDAKKTAETVMRRFEYDPRGRLTAEIDADGAKTDYRVGSDASGSAVTVTSGGKEARSDVVRYDPALRPVQAQYADGTQATWSYPQGGGLVMDLTLADGRKIRLTEAADQRSRSVQLTPDRKLETQYDAAGRLTSLTDNGQPVLRQKWAPDGRLLVASNLTSAANFEYSADGLISRVLLAPPGENGTFKVWQAIHLDEAGRPLEITDYRGLQTAMDYTGSGELRAATVKRDGKNYGFQIDRDASGHVREVKSSWGASQYAYDPAGLLTRVDIESMGQKSSAEWKSGLLQKVRKFDGGEFTVTFYEDGKRAGLPREIVMPNRLTLAYEYNASNRLSQVVVGSVYRLSLDYDAKGLLVGWSYSPHQAESRR